MCRLLHGNLQQHVILCRRVSLNVNCGCYCNKIATCTLEVCHLPLAVFVECESFYAFCAYLYSVANKISAVRVNINYLLALTMGSYNVLV